jgi:hypothetical protein
MFRLAKVATIRLNMKIKTKLYSCSHFPHVHPDDYYFSQSKQVAVINL